jgi:hypothetical protein
MVSQAIHNAAHRAFHKSPGIEHLIEVVAEMAANEIRAAVIEEFGPLVRAVTDDFTSEDTASYGDDVTVADSIDTPTKLTFGHIRRARQALASMRLKIDGDKK